MTSFVGVKPTRFLGSLLIKAAFAMSPIRDDAIAAPVESIGQNQETGFLMAMLSPMPLKVDGHGQNCITNKLIKAAAT
jgi:hypothetical protein